MQTTKQRMAVSALEEISTVSAAERQKYGSMAHKLPILIHNAGLAQALAFVETRGDSAQTKLLNHIATTVAWEGAGSGAGLARLSREVELRDYMLLTRRVLSALVWYKRYAESVLKVQARDDSETVVSGEAAADAVQQ